MADRVTEIAGRARRPTAVGALRERAAGDAVPPTPLTSFIGREHDLVAVGELLQRRDVRLVTLVGPAGVGKTRLAIEVASRIGDAFADGVRYVALAAVREEALVVPTVARDLGVWEIADRSVAELLVDRLREARLLLVLDNLEQVTGAASALSWVLSSCPGVTMLLTSRSHLRISGEHAYPVAPLPVPDATGPRHLDALERVDAVRLFVQRAAAARAGFVLDDGNASAVAALCRRLDGLPLAIELAAARVAHLPPHAILARLDPTLPMLTGGPTDAPLRQRTMRDAVAWSYDLLTEDERQVMRRLAVFVGGCDLAGAEAVARFDRPDRGDALDRVSSLLDQSLLSRAASPGDEPRFTMLEAIREYGLERLAESGEESAVRQAHADHFLHLAEEAAPHLAGSGQREWLERLEVELANLRAALGWRGGPDDDEQRGLRMTAALAMWWYVRNHLAEGSEQVERALADASREPTVARAGALRASGMMAFARGDYAAARDALIASLPIAERHQDRKGVGLAWFWLALIAEYEGDEAGATTAFERAHGLFREIDDVLWTALTVSALGDAACRRGEVDEAEALCAEGVRLARSVGDPFVLWNTLQTQGNVQLARDHWDEASRIHREELAVALGIGDLRGVADGLAGVGGAAVGGGRPDVGARLLGAADRSRMAIGRAKLPGHAQFERAVANAEAALGADAFRDAWDAGVSLTLHEAIALAQAGLGDHPGGQVGEDASTRMHGLSPRELDVLRLLVLGRSDREIAAELFISRRTAAWHVSSIIGKLDAVSRTDAAVRAVRNGIV